MINDFGEKIGCARKDHWKERGLMVEDLDGMTQGEKEKYSKKDCVWPKEDIKALVADGMPRFVVYFRNEVRKWVHPQPKARISAESYIEGVRKIKELTGSIKEESDIPAFVEKLTSMILFKSGRYYDYVDDYRGIIKGQNILNYGRAMKLRQLKAKMFKERFAMTEQEIMDHEYPILYIDGDTFVIEENMGKLYVVQKFPTGKIFYHPTNGIVPREQTWFVLRGNDIVFLSKIREECLKEQKKLFDLSETKKAKKASAKRKNTWIPPQFVTLDRTGDDFRHGRHVSGDDFIETFHIRGGEFGNWTNEKERQASLDMAYDAFYDMAKAVGIRAEDVSLPALSTKGLAIAFGARGRGNALAHYEQDLEVINLTKLRGAGSLAHEWGHALDHMIGQAYTSSSVFATETRSKDIPKSFTNVMEAIRFQKGAKNFTSYYLDSYKYGNQTAKTGHGYWTSSCELFARAFACYVQDRLSGVNDYLCGHAEANFGTDDDGNDIFAYPRGEEREYINEKFDLLFKGLIREGIFKPYKVPAAKIETPMVESTVDYSYCEGANGQLSFF